MALSPIAALAAALLASSQVATPPSTKYVSHASVKSIRQMVQSPMQEIPFTEGILKFSDLSDFSWRNWRQLFPLNSRKYALRVQANGDLDYLASNDRPSMVTPASSESLENMGLSGLEPDAPFAPGTPLYHVRIRQELRAAGTERFVSLVVTNYSGRELISLEFITEGTELKELPAENLANGLLPFYPSAPTEQVSRTTIVLLGSERVTTTVRKEISNGVDYLEVLLGQGQKGNLFLMYREWNSLTEHRLFYHYASTVGGNPEEFDWAAGTTLEVRKIRKPGDLIGSEYFWVDHAPVGMTTFQNSFNKVILTPISQSWQSGFGLYAGYLFMPGFVQSFENLGTN